MSVYLWICQYEICHPWMSWDILSVLKYRFNPACVGVYKHIWNPDFRYMPGIYHVYPMYMPS